MSEQVLKDRRHLCACQPVRRANTQAMRGVVVRVEDPPTLGVRLRERSHVKPPFTKVSRLRPYVEARWRSRQAASRYLNFTGHTENRQALPEVLDGFLWVLWDFRYPGRPGALASLRPPPRPALCQAEWLAGKVVLRGYEPPL